MPRELVLYLVRHAIAEERSEKYPDDDLRPLTPEGMSKFRLAVEGLERIGVSLDAILTSPLVRARQTAEILSAGISRSPEPIETDALRPGASFERLARAIKECGDCGAIALVGHEPGIGETAARLIAAAVPLPFKKGAVCRIDFTDWPRHGVGELRWFATQKMLRKMAGGA